MINLHDLGQVANQSTISGNSTDWEGRFDSQRLLEENAVLGKPKFSTFRIWLLDTSSITFLQSTCVQRDEFFVEGQGRTGSETVTQWSTRMRVSQQFSDSE